MKLATPFEGLDLANAKTPTGDFTFKKSPTILKLATGLILFESDLDVDCDGRWPHNDQDPDAQKDTSLHDSAGRALDASLTPFFVLPAWFAIKHNIDKGDYAAITWRGKLSFAIYGDAGPKRKIGEASLLVHDHLGNPNFVNGKYRNIGIDAGVQTLVFPRSGDGSVPSADEIQARGRELLDAALNRPRPRVGISGREDPWGDELGEAVALDGGHRRVPLRQFVAWALKVSPSQVPVTWDNATRKATLKSKPVPSARRSGESPVTALVGEIMEILKFEMLPGANETFVEFRKNSG
jgi:hypothetical protein